MAPNIQLAGKFATRSSSATATDAAISSASSSGEAMVAAAACGDDGAIPVSVSSIGNAASEPWDYTVEDAPLDLDLQKRLYEGFFNVWHGNPNLGGYSIWEWPPGEGGKDDNQYTPEGKPAQEELRMWLAK